MMSTNSACIYICVYIWYFNNLKAATSHISQMEAESCVETAVQVPFDSNRQRENKIFIKDILSCPLEKK